MLIMEEIFEIEENKENIEELTRKIYFYMIQFKKKEININNYIFIDFLINFLRRASKYLEFNEIIELMKLFNSKFKKKIFFENSISEFISNTVNYPNVLNNESNYSTELKDFYIENLNKDLNNSSNNWLLIYNSLINFQKFSEKTSINYKNFLPIEKKQFILQFISKKIEFQEKSSLVSTISKTVLNTKSENLDKLMKNIRLSNQGKENYNTSIFNFDKNGNNLDSYIFTVFDNFQVIFNNESKKLNDLEKNNFKNILLKFLKENFK
jgi:hypothetical protein